MKIIFLPATAPADLRYGCPEQEWPEIHARFPGAECATICFDTLVWYNQAVRRDAFARISGVCGSGCENTILVGFSKSGCGAINLALDNPGLFRSVIVFDSPLVNENINRFELRKFYPDSRALKDDVPMLRIRNGETYGRTTLLLVSGESFPDEMAAFAAVLKDRSLLAITMEKSRYPHHWNSGWIIPALAVILQQPLSGGKACA